MKSSTIRFSANRADFFTTLNQRVNEHFKSNKIQRHANTEMKIKTLVMFLLYWGPFLVLLSGSVQSNWGMLGIVVIMGLGLAGIGLSVMHDANHGAYSNKSWVNNLLGFSLNMVGGNAFNWKVQHNVLH